MAKKTVEPPVLDFEVPSDLEVMMYKGRPWFHRHAGVDRYVVKEGDYNGLVYGADDVWIDAGGNIGCFAFKAAPFVKQVISYEPEASNIRVFEYNQKLNPQWQNVIVHQAALAAENGEISFFVTDKHPYSHSVLKIRGRREIKVPTLSMDEQIKKYGANRLKLDVEGAERDIILGSTFDGIDDMIMEWHSAYLHPKVPHNEAPLFKQCMDHLSDHGFDWTFIKIQKKWGNEANVILSVKRR